MAKDKQVQTTTQAITPVDNSAEALIAKAIDKNVSVDTMERLLIMRRELKAEYAKEQFDRAMASFQAKCPVIEKRKQGYNYKYAPLESIVEQVKGLLSDNGFSYTFDTQEAENAVVIICNVKHIAGHAEVSKATITKETTTKMNASQQSGAAMTYGKRYAFVNAFGILTGDEDTDAHSDTKNAPNTSPAPQKPYTDDEGITHEPVQSTGAAGKTVYATPKQVDFIWKLLEQKGWDEQDVFTKYKVASIAALTLQNAKQIIDNLLKLPDSEVDQIIDDAANALG